MTDRRKLIATGAANAAAIERCALGAYKALRDASTAPDGYPTQTVGAAPYSGPGRPHTCDQDPEGCDACHPVDLTATERAALAQQREDQRIAEMDTALEVWVNAGARYYALVRRYNPPADDHPRCSGGQGHDGAIDWGRPTCENNAAPDRGGLCYACAKRRAEWRAKRDGRAA